MTPSTPITFPGFSCSVWRRLLKGVHLTTHRRLKECRDNLVRAPSEQGDTPTTSKVEPRQPHRHCKQGESGSGLQSVTDFLRLGGGDWQEMFPKGNESRSTWQNSWVKRSCEVNLKELIVFPGRKRESSSHLLYLGKGHGKVTTGLSLLNCSQPALGSWALEL